MVFFSCEGCNETLKKAQVENHIRRCNCPVSCVDCSKVFPGLTYHQHTSCISEAEKYEKTLYKGPKGNKGKKRNPQEQWMDMINETAAEISRSDASGPVKTYLPRMAETGNVPRNEKKFKNFISNSLRLHRPADQDQLWQFLKSRLDGAKAEEQAANGTTAAVVADGEKREEGVEEVEKAVNGKLEDDQGDAGGAKKKEKKRKKMEGVEEVAPAEEKEEDKPAQKKKKKGKKDEDSKEEVMNGNAATKEDEEAEKGDTSEIAWDKIIKKIVKKSDQKQISIKELQAQVLAEVMKQPAEAKGAGGKQALKKIFKEKIRQGLQDLIIDEGEGIRNRRSEQQQQRSSTASDVDPQVEVIAKRGLIHGLSFYVLWSLIITAGVITSVGGNVPVVFDLGAAWLVKMEATVDSYLLMNTIDMVLKSMKEA